MTTTLFVILVIIIALLSVACSTCAAEISTLKTVLKLRNRDYDEIMGRALKAETDFTYLKDTISTMLQRPVVATLRDDQLKMVSEAIALAAMQGVASVGHLKN